MLEELGYDGKRIFSAELSHDRNMLVLEEACDCYFNTELTKKQAQELISELQRLVDHMPMALPPTPEET